MESFSRFIGGFTTWWLVATLTMWVFSWFGIHTGIKSRKYRVFLYVVLGIAILGFFVQSFSS